MNLGQLAARVSAVASINNDSGSEEQGLLYAWANEGVREVLLKTHCYVEIGDALVTAGVGDYRLDVDMLAIVDKTLTSSNQQSTFEQINSADLLLMRRTTGSSPARYFALLGHDLLMIYPTPDLADTVRYFFVPLPTEMTLTTHDPSQSPYGGIPVWGHKAIEHYMLMQAYQKDGTRSGQAELRQEQLFDKECAKITHFMRGKGGRTLSAARLGGSQMPFVNHRNDVY